MSVSFALFSKFALLTLANLEKGCFCLDRIELAQCRLTVLYRLLFSSLLSVLPFLAALRFWFFLFCLALLLLLFALLDCAGGFRSCGSDHGLCPLDSHKPLKRLDRNFKCFCAVTFVSPIGFCAVLAARLLSLVFALSWARLNKK